MPTLAQISGIRIMMFQSNHDPPHFHAFGADFETKLSIDPCALMESRGRLRARDLLLIRNWALQQITLTCKAVDFPAAPFLSF
jgi:hypothetical protein